MHDSASSTQPVSSIMRLYATLWRHAQGRRQQVVIFVVLLVLAQGVRLTIPWFFGEAVNALQARGMEGITRARNDLLLMLAAVGVAWIMHGPARILERFNALAVRERFADALHAKVLALPVRWHEQQHSGDTLHRITKGTSSLFAFAQSQFIYLQNTVSVIGPIAALFLVSWQTGTAALVGYAAIGCFVVRIDALMVLLVREENRAERRYSSALVDCLTNIASVLTLRLQEPMRKMLGSRLLEVFAPLRRTIVFNEVKWGRWSRRWRCTGTSSSAKRPRSAMWIRSLPVRRAHSMPRRFPPPGNRSTSRVCASFTRARPGDGRLWTIFPLSCAGDSGLPSSARAARERARCFAFSPV